MGSTKISAPATPAAPTPAENAQSYAQALPIYWENQLKYAPMEAQQQVDLAQQYAAPLGQAYKTAQEAMYPQETAMNQQLMDQVNQGISADMPDWAKQSYMDTMRAQLGDNALAGVGADYMSRGLLEQQKSWQDYYRNLGLSITGRQPVYNAQSPTYSNMVGNYTPTANANYTAQNYGNYSNAYSSMYNTNAQMAQFNAGQPMAWMGAAGGLMGGIGQMGGLGNIWGK